MFVAAWTPFRLVLKFTCEFLRPPGDGLDDDDHSKKWYGVRASKSTPLLFGVSGHWLIIDSTLPRRAVNASSVNKHSPSDLSQGLFHCFK